MQTLFDNAERELYELNDAQKQAIEAGRKDIEKGNYKYHEQAMEEMEIWLKRQ
ncbi:hypothetical protein [Proteiniphilum sp.]|uniref:hypothetical protein n=1 Tax=Proteiniphilum sp. TaxID=1926877 RepID=UPI00331BAB83